MNPTSPSPETEQRVEELFERSRQAVYRRTDRWFAGLMLFQWITGIIIALWVSPRTWAGQTSSVHIHVWSAVFLGGAIAGFPIALAILRPGAALTRYCVAIAQMLFSALLIHLTGGRIETHFHVFGSLAFLAFYRDWRVLVPATIVVAVDHFLRGIYWPYSAFGVLTASPWRSLEHAGWVIFENIFLATSCVRSVREMRGIAERQVKLESTNEIIEEKVVERTAEARASEERFRLLVDGVADHAMIMLDAEGRVISWNHGAERIHGYRAQEIIGRDFSCFYCDDDRAAGLPQRELATARETNRFEDEGCRVRKDGTQFFAHVFVTALRDDTGTLRGFSKVTRDVTERRLAAAALRAAHDSLEARVLERTEELAHANRELQAEIAERLAAEAEARRVQGFLTSVVENIPDMIFIKDARDLRVVLFNRAGEELIGLPREKVVGRSVFDLFPAQAEADTADDRKVLTEHLPLDIPEELLHTHNGVRTVHTKKIPLFDASGSVQYLLGISEDITARQQADQALRSAKEEAERANRAKSEFLSRMSHELRTPLNAILGFGQLLELDGRESRRVESAGHITRAGRHLLGLIDEVLAISRIEAGHMHLSLEPVAVSEMVKECLSLVKSQAAARGVSCEDSCTPGDGRRRYVHADRQRLRQVLLNLLSNAIKYNRAGGQVTISCQARPATSAEDGQAERLRIEVADTGPGLTVEEIGRLFTPFERLGAEGTAVEGTGLGLALSKGLVEAMSGRIGVDSVPGEGSTFWVELGSAADPLLVADAALRPPDFAADAFECEGTVLYIEDNLSNLRLIEMLLESRPGVQLLSAQQGMLGLELAQARRPDLILLDLHLPDLPGWKVLAQLRADARTRDIPTVIISADATPGQIARLRTAGACDYLTKPVDVPKLMQMLDEHLSSHGVQLVPAV